MSCDVCAVVELKLFQEPSEKIHKENHSQWFDSPRGPEYCCINKLEISRVSLQLLLFFPSHYIVFLLPSYPWFHVRKSSGAKKMSCRKSSVFISHCFKQLVPDSRDLRQSEYHLMTSNNQRLGSPGDSDWRSKHFCCNALFCVSFTWQTVKTHVIRLQEVEGQITHDQICVMCIPFILSGSPFQMLATYICNACMITTSRLGLGAPLVSHNQN